MHFSSLATRLVVPILALAAFTLPLVGIGARQAVKSNANDVRDGLEAWYAAGVKTPILVPSSASGGQVKAFEEFFATFG